MKNLGEYVMQGWKNNCRWALGVLASSMIAVVSQVNATTLEDINFTSLPGNEFEIQLGFSDAPPQPEVYTIEEPARIVLDFPGVDNSIQEKKHNLSFENAKNAVILSADGKTRLIVSLNELTGYTAKVDGNKLLLTVGGSGAAVSSSAYTAKEISGTTGRSLKNLDFSRGESGEGLITLSLSDTNISTDVSRSGNKIVAKLFYTALPSELDRRLDVIDFATPVKSIDSKMDGSAAVITIEASGEYDYLAYQADNQYVISVKPLTPAELEEKNAKFAFVGEKLSLNFQDIEVRSVLQLIADFTELNLVASDTVTGNITLRLDNVPWDQALDIVLKAKGLDKRLEGNVLLVAPAAEIAERERLQVEANKQLEELAPLVTEFIRIRYADAKELFELFNIRRNDDNTNTTVDEDKPATRSILSERGSAIVDSRTNTIILTDTEEKVAQFRKLVEKIDIPIRQVEISARIVIASTDFKKELGVKWGVAAVRNPGDNLLEIVGSRAGLDSEPGSPAEYFAGTGSLDLGESLAVDLGVSDSAGASGSLALGFMTDSTFLDLELSALENSGYGEIASQPKVLTGDKQKAVIRSGQEIAYQESTSSGATSVKFKEAVLKLEVTPQITPDNRIILSLFISQDNLTDVVFGGTPVLDITDISTQALVGDGQTLVLGGIFQYQDIKSTEKIPLLGDIPVVGNLFKNRFKSSEKREILIFVTPKILDDQLLDK